MRKGVEFLRALAARLIVGLNMLLVLSRLVPLRPRKGRRRR